MWNKVAICEILREKSDAIAASPVELPQSDCKKMIDNPQTETYIDLKEELARGSTLAKAKYALTSGAKSSLTTVIGTCSREQEVEISKCLAGSCFKIARLFS